MNHTTRLVLVLASLSMVTTMACGGSGDGGDEPVASESASSPLAVGCGAEVADGAVVYGGSYQQSCAAFEAGLTGLCRISHRAQPVKRQCTNSTTKLACTQHWFELYVCATKSNYPLPATNYGCRWYGHDIEPDDCGT